MLAPESLNGGMDVDYHLTISAFFKITVAKNLCDKAPYSKNPRIKLNFDGLPNDTCSFFQLNFLQSTKSLKGAGCFFFDIFKT